MSLKVVIWVFFAVSVFCVLPNVAAAGGPYFAWGGIARCRGDIGGYRPASIYTVERRPYFALHPPVYYSYPVARTYGLLPYPYLPAPVTRDILRPVPHTIVNPYVVESGSGGGPQQAALPRRVSVTYPAAIFDKAE